MTLPASIHEKLVSWFGFPAKPVHVQIATTSKDHPHIRTMFLYEVTEKGNLIFLSHTQTQKWYDLEIIPNISGALVNLDMGQLVVEGKALLNTKQNADITHYWENLHPNFRKIYTTLTEEINIPDTFGLIMFQPTSWEILELNKDDYIKSKRSKISLINSIWVEENLTPL